MIYVVKDRQSLLDIALLCYGSAQAVIRLAQENNLSVSAPLVPGTPITYGQISENAILKQYALQTIEPATALDGELSFGGIGQMGIEIDFIIK